MFKSAGTKKSLEGVKGCSGLAEPSTAAADEIGRVSSNDNFSNKVSPGA